VYYQPTSANHGSRVTLNPHSSLRLPTQPPRFASPTNGGPLLSQGMLSLLLLLLVPVLNAGKQSSLVGIMLLVGSAFFYLWNAAVGLQALLLLQM
jgi:hypothetical protein